MAQIEKALLSRVSMSKMLARVALAQTTAPLRSPCDRSGLICGVLHAEELCFGMRYQLSHAQCAVAYRGILILLTP